MAPHANTITASLETRKTSSAGKPHDDYGPQFNAIIWVLTGTAAIFVGFRLFAKRRWRRKLWWDDYVLIAALACLIIQTCLLSVMVHFDFGKHGWDVRDWYTYLMLAYPTGVFSVTAAAWSKTSFAITLLRLTDGWWRRFIWFVIISVNLFLGLSAMFSYIQCWPIGQLWDNSIPGDCWPPNVIVDYNSFASCWSGAMDIMLAMLPWWFINRRSLNKKERLGVKIAMSMGVFAGMTSIGKTATLWGIKDPDSISSVPVMILATAEIAITIIAASIPVLRVLIKNTLRGQSVPHLYHYYHSQDPQPEGFPSDGDLIGRPAPVVTKSQKGSQFSTDLSSQGSHVLKTFTNNSDSPVAGREENGQVTGRSHDESDREHEGHQEQPSKSGVYGRQDEALRL